MIIFLCGNRDDVDKFDRLESYFNRQGDTALNMSYFPKGKVGRNIMLNVMRDFIIASDILFMVSGWEKDHNSVMCLQYAQSLGKTVIYEEQLWEIYQKH